MKSVPPHVRETITRLVRESAGQSVSIDQVIGAVRKQFPHLPVLADELTGLIATEALGAGRGVDFDHHRPRRPGRLNLLMPLVSDARSSI